MQRLTSPGHILVFRFSSLGDIAMTVPVVKLALLQHPRLRITFVSVAFVKPLFEDIDRLEFVAADIHGKHKGVGGLYKLYKQLNKDPTIDAIADLHNVLRSQILRFFFAFKKSAAIDKGRKEKREMTRQHDKVVKPLRSTFHRYADVFAALGVLVELIIKGGCLPVKSKPADYSTLRVGIAPFARYAEKTYPFEKMKQVVKLLLVQSPAIIVLSGGKEDVPLLNELVNECPDRIQSIATLSHFTEQLAAISVLDVMISMDSANMHLASLYGVPVVSVWGGTHPFLGFLGWGQNYKDCIQIDLDCRPSSMFGNKPCPNHLACLDGISPIQIAEKVLQILDNRQSKRQP